MWRKMTDKKILDIQAIKNADDRRLVEVDLTEEWGGIVFIKPLSGKQRDWIEVNSGDKRQSLMMRSKIAVMSVCDANGQLMFTDADIEWLCEKSGVALEKILKAVTSVNAVQAGDIEALEKN